MVGTLYVTLDAICNGTLRRPLEFIEKRRLKEIRELVLEKEFLNYGNTEVRKLLKYGNLQKV